MEKRLDKLEEKLDTIIEKLQDQNLTLARNTDSLVIHEKRTDLAEQKLNVLELEYKAHFNKDELVLGSIEEKLTPIYKHVTLVNAMVKYVLPAVTAVLAFLFKIGVIKLK